MADKAGGPGTSEGPTTGRGYGRLLVVLELIAARQEPITLSELARAVQIPKATTTLLVQHLVARRYLEVLEDRTLHIGPRYLRLGTIVAGRATGNGSAGVAIRGIARATDLDTYLGIVADREVTCADRAEGRGMLRVDVGLGVGQPLHCTAMGKAALAFGSPELWQEVGDGPLARYTDRTIVDEESLRADVDQWRTLGYTVSDGEHFEGLTSVAVPVHDARGVERILTVLGHQRSVTDRLPEVVALLQQAAGRIATGPV